MSGRRLDPVSHKLCLIQTSHGVMGAQLRVPLKTLDTIDCCDVLLKSLNTIECCDVLLKPL